MTFFPFQKDFDCCAKIPKPAGCFKTREEYALYLLSKENKLRVFCLHVITQKWFDYTILLFIACNCITLAMERPSIPPNSVVSGFDHYSTLQPYRSLPCPPRTCACSYPYGNRILFRVNPGLVAVRYGDGTVR